MAVKRIRVVTKKAKHAARHLKELRDIQGFWHWKAEGMGILTERKLQNYLKG
jgi:hypothetical protein